MSRLVRFAVIVLANGLAVAPRAGAAGTTELISASGTTGRAVGAAYPSVDATGRYVLFDSGSSELVADDTKGHPDVFLHDREAGRTTRVSVGPGGRELNNTAWRGWITANARYVLFSSSATNVATNGSDDFSYQGYIRDLQAGINECVSVSSTGLTARFPGALALEASESGRMVLFTTRADNLVPGATGSVQRLYLRDRVTGQTATVGPAAAETLNGHLSGNGRFVTFSTRYSITQPDLGVGHEVYVKDLATGQYEIVSRSSSGLRANAAAVPYDVSHDGRYVVFGSAAANLVPNDTNGQFDLFLRDRQTGTTERISVASNEAQANGTSLTGQVSDDGRFVAFWSEATNLVAGSTTSAHVYLRDRVRGTTQRVDVSTTGVPGNGPVEFNQMAISADGHVVAFASLADNLAPGDGNTYDDIYAHETQVENGFEWTVFPAGLVFGSVAVGQTSAAQTVTIRNMGSAALPLPWIAVIGQNRLQFERVRHCPVLLAPGKSCFVTVTFSPTYRGAKAARLLISTEPAGEPKYVPLTGTGT